MEALVCVAGLAASTLIAFNAWFVYGIHDFQLAYLPVPFLLWGTFRFGPRGAATGTLVVAALAFYVLGMDTGRRSGQSGGLRCIGSYLCILAAFNLLLAAVAAERRRAEINLAENEKRLRAVVAGQPDLICRFLPDGKITFVNPAFCEFHGQTEAQLLGTDFFQSSRRTRRRRCAKNWPRCRRTGPAWTFDRRAVAAADHVVWQQYNLRRFAGDGGKGFEYPGRHPGHHAAQAGGTGLAGGQGHAGKNEPPAPSSPPRRPTPPPTRPTAPTPPRASFSRT